MAKGIGTQQTGTGQIQKALSTEILIDAQANYDAASNTLTIPTTPASNQSASRIKLTTEIQGIVVANTVTGTPIEGEVITFTQSLTTFTGKIGIVTNSTHFTVTALSTGSVTIDNTVTYVTHSGAIGAVTSLTGGFIQFINHAPSPLPFQLYNDVGISNPILSMIPADPNTGVIQTNTGTEATTPTVAGLLLIGRDDISNSDVVVLQNNSIGDGNNAIQYVLTKQ